MTYPLFILAALAIMFAAIAVQSITIIRLSRRIDTLHRQTLIAHHIACSAERLAKRSPFHASYQTKP